MSAVVHALRQQLELRHPGTLPLVHGVAPAAPTGVAALDALLPGGGLPRGRLTAWAPGFGTVAVLGSACGEALARGERAAWVDAAGTLLAGERWSGITVLRPSTPRDARVCAEELLRSGGFAVVVLAGAATEGTERVRLTRAAREGGGAWVEVSADGWMAALRVTSRVPPGGLRWTRSPGGEALRLESVAVRVRAAALGWGGEAEIELPVVRHEVRMCLDAGLGDRRGAR